MNIDSDKLNRISPYPWNVVEYNEIVDANNNHLVVTDSGFYPPEENDAHIMAAAPELLLSVVELYDLVEKYVSFPKRCLALKNDMSMKLYRARKAIDKAMNNE